MNADGPPLSCREVAEALGVSARFVQKLVHAGALEAFRLPSAGATDRPGRLRIPRSRVIAMLARRRIANVANVANRANAGKQTLDIAPAPAASLRRREKRCAKTSTSSSR
jgi:excisionase family DNA binding protein